VGNSALQAQTDLANLEIDLIEQQQVQSYILQKKQEKEMTQRALVGRAFEADEDTLRAALKSKSGAERFAAAYAIGERQLYMVPELIELLVDSNPNVRQASRRSLIILSYVVLQTEQGQSASQSSGTPPTSATPSTPATSPGVDFGPKMQDEKPAQVEAQKKWREWWAGHGKSQQSQLRVVRSDEDLDAEAARLSSALVLADPAQQLEKLSHYRQEKGIVYTEAMANALSQLEGEALKKGREYLAERLARMTAATLRNRLSDSRPELRRAAALAWAAKEDRAAVPELIPLLEDPEEVVVRGAKAALKSLTGQDFGPARGASAFERSAAITAWKTWWRKQS
jgi:hypothetical protein